jgi:hypothetical protein
MEGILAMMIDLNLIKLYKIHYLLIANQKFRDLLIIISLKICK